MINKSPKGIPVSIKNTNKKSFVLQLVLLTGFIAINIFPAGCFSWGRTPITTPNTGSSPYPSPPPLISEEIFVNGDAYLKTLECAASLPNINAVDKTEVTSRKEQIRSGLPGFKDGKVTVKRTEIINYNTKFPECNFSSLILLGENK